MDYNSLTDQIKKYAYRTDVDFNAQVPNIIQQAMSRIYSEAKGSGFQKVVVSVLAANDINRLGISKPLGFRQVVSIQLTIPAGQRLDNKPFFTYLDPRSYEYCITYAPDPTTFGTPIYYSDDMPVPQENTLSFIYLAPSADFAYQYRLTYLTYPPVFDAGNSRNFVTDKYPNLLLNACLIETMIYLKYDERIPVFESKYKAALDAINNDTKGRYVDRTGKRDKT